MCSCELINELTTISVVFHFIRSTTGDPESEFKTVNLNFIRQTYTFNMPDQWPPKASEGQESTMDKQFKTLTALQGHVSRARSNLPYD